MEAQKSVNILGSGTEQEKVGFLRIAATLRVQEKAVELSRGVGDGEDLPPYSSVAEEDKDKQADSSTSPLEKAPVDLQAGFSTMAGISETIHPLFSKEGTVSFLSDTRLNSVGKWLVKKAQWESKIQHGGVYRGIFEDIHSETIHTLLTEGWTLVPIQAVLAWDMRNTTMARILKEDFRGLWKKETNAVTVQAIDHEKLRSYLPGIEKAEIFRIVENGDENGDTPGTSSNGIISLDFGSFFWVFEENIEKDNSATHQWNLLLARSLKNSRDRHAVVVSSAYNAKDKIMRGAHWDIEWIAIKGKPNLWTRLAKTWFFLLLRAGARKRLALYTVNTPYEH